VTIGPTVYTVIGVAPPEFFGVTVGQSPDLWIPLAMEKEVSPGWNGLDNNLFQWLYIFARRKSGISVQQASANTNLLFQQIVLRYAGPHPSPRQLEDIGHAKVELTQAATGLSQLRRQLASPLQITGWKGFRNQLGHPGHRRVMGPVDDAESLAPRAAVRWVTAQACHETPIRPAMLWKCQR
jgi:hypothetical protein